MDGAPILARFARPCPAFAAAAMLCIAPLPAVASTLRVDPIKVEISAERKIASIRVQNVDSAPVSVRAYCMAWSQAAGEDRYEESDALIVSPPVASIAPGTTQIVRVGFRPGAALRGAYRLIVEEIPSADPGGGVHVALRLNLPLYVNIASRPASELHWRGFQRPDKTFVIEATNPTDGYVRAEVVDIAAATGLRPSSISGFGVVLPNSKRQWVVGAAPEIADRTRFETLLRAASPDGPPRG
jgi:fimbrial chaperone protein